VWAYPGTAEFSTPYYLLYFARTFLVSIGTKAHCKLNDIFALKFSSITILTQFPFKGPDSAFKNFVLFYVVHNNAYIQEA